MQQLSSAKQGFLMEFKCKKEAQVEALTGGGSDDTKEVFAVILSVMNARPLDSFSSKKGEVKIMFTYHFALYFTYVQVWAPISETWTRRRTKRGSWFCSAWIKD